MRVAVFRHPRFTSTNLPLDLDCQTKSDFDCRLQASTTQAKRALGTRANRWFCDAAELLTSSGETWALANQWSWDESYGSSQDDLERVQRLFPKLGLSWRRI